jgi:energy-coupling factor transporter transmembrane protein EcfT
MLLLAVPPVFFLGELDSTVFGVSYSSEGYLAGLQIGMRFIVVMTAVQGFTASVDVPALAGLLERLGLQGLGFTSGVALNLLPYIQQSSLNAWRSLRMRGGLRRNWRQGLRLLAMTVATNSLQRAEEVALAAEGRAFSPDKARPMPIRRGSLDWIPVVAGLGTLILMIFV